MTENKGSSQPKNGKMGSPKQKNKNVKKRLSRLLAFINCLYRFSSIRHFIICVLCMESSAFTESKLQDPKPAEIYDRNGDLVKKLDNGARREHVELKMFLKI